MKIKYPLSMWSFIEVVRAAWKVVGGGSSTMDFVVEVLYI